MSFTPEQLAQIAALIAASRRSPSPHTRRTDIPLDAPHVSASLAQSQTAVTQLPYRPSVPAVLNLAPSLATTVLPQTLWFHKIVETHERQAATERDLVKRLCHLLRPSEESVWPPLLRLIVVAPGQITSSPQLRLRLAAAGHRFTTEHPALHAALVAHDRPLSAQELGATTPVAVECCLLAALGVARSLGPWAIIGRVDLYRQARHNGVRYERTELTAMLEQLAEEWLLQDDRRKDTSEKHKEDKPDKRPREERK